MTATSPKSCASSMGWSSAASPSAGCAASSVWHRATAGAHPRRAGGASRRPRGARWCKSTAVPLRGSRPAARSSCSSAPSTTPRARSWPCTSGPPRTSTATPRSSSSSSPRTALPLALYGDRLNLLIRNDPHWSIAEELAGTQHPTHLGRMLQDLGIGYVAAHSPQAKGRIERLWATLQDRLVSELRLRGLTTVPAAIAYLPEFIADFNRRFGKPPATPQPVWRRPPPDLALVLSCRYRRVVARDNTVRVGPRVAQLRGGRSYAGLTVEARELLDGPFLVLHHGAIPAPAPPPSGPFLLKPRRAPNADRRLSRPRPAPRPAPPRSAPKTHTGRHPLPTHPWVLANDRSVRLRELKTGRTFSRSSKAGHFH